jgi:Fe2+ or Zn2+ uptake regulation protein
MRLTLEQLCQLVVQYVRQEHPALTPVALRIDLADGRRIQTPITIHAAGQAAAPTPEPILTPCQQDIIKLLEDTGRRMTVNEILTGLEAADMIHGESTVRHALPEMNRRGLLDNRHDAWGKGYGLGEWTTAGRHELTPREKDILVLIEEAGHRMTVVEVLAALEAAGKIHGESTVRCALPYLRNVAKLLNNKSDDYGRGYGLAEWE